METSKSAHFPKSNSIEPIKLTSEKVKIEGSVGENTHQITHEEEPKYLPFAISTHFQQVTLDSSNQNDDDINGNSNVISSSVGAKDGKTLEKTDECVISSDLGNIFSANRKTECLKSSNVESDGFDKFRNETGREKPFESTGNSLYEVGENNSVKAELSTQNSESADDYKNEKAMEDTPIPSSDCPSTAGVTEPVVVRKLVSALSTGHHSRRVTEDDEAQISKRVLINYSQHDNAPALKGVTTGKDGANNCPLAVGKVNYSNVDVSHQLSALLSLATENCLEEGANDVGMQEDNCHSVVLCEKQELLKSLQQGASSDVFAGNGSSYPDYFLTFLQDSEYSLSLEDYGKILEKERQLLVGRPNALVGDSSGAICKNLDKVFKVENVEICGKITGADAELEVSRKIKIIHFVINILLLPFCLM